MKRRWFLMGILILVVLLAGCVSAFADGGTYRGVSWDLTDGVLTLGNGNSQTMVFGNTSWPWSGNKDSITSVVCDGTIVFNGSIQGMLLLCRLCFIIVVRSHLLVLQIGMWHLSHL